MCNRLRIICLAAILSLNGTIASALAADSKRDALWSAVRAGDAKAVAAALDKGADVNAKNELGISALWIAASKEKLDVIQLLVRRGADVNVRDDIWYQTPLSSTTGGRQLEAAKFLIKAGAKDVDAALFTATSQRNEPMVKMILENGKVGQDALDASLFAATTAKNEKLQKILTQAGAKPIPPASAADRKAWSKLTGMYESDGGAMLMIGMTDVGLISSGRWLKPTGPDTFTPLGSEGSSIRVERKGDEVARVVMKKFTAEYGFYRFTKSTTKAAVADVAGGLIAKPLNWPSFRGPDGTGVADGQKPPVTWNLKEGKNVRWKTPIPGLGHSCPVVWGNRVFLTTAIGGDPDPKIRVGNYGDVASVNDTSKHKWQVLCCDRDTGKILWTKTAYEGVPKIKRHLKGSQANCTPATDGRHVVACFGSEGLYCYDFTGKLLWKRDLSTLDSSFAIDQEYEWGFGNSPLVYDGLAILQCDLSKDSFIAAFNLDTGEKVWSTPRDEIPSWSSPTIWRNSQRVELVTNAAQYARGYDPKTGVELWRLAKKSEVTIPAPVCGKDLLFITSGNRPIQPIYAIKPGSNGDISLKKDEASNSSIAWSKMRGGPYMPTPILYGAYFYTCSNSGVVACYEAATGNEIYKKRIGGASYTASPVAADGRLYFASEQGEIRVVKAGPDFELLAVNPIDDYIMATPAISNGSLFVRSQHFLISLGKKQAGSAKAGNTDGGSNPSLLAGTAVADITPAPGLRLWGYGNRVKAATGTLDPLKARAVVLRCGSASVAIVSLDLGRTPEEDLLAGLRERLTKTVGIKNLFITASHTHQAPVVDAPGGMPNKFAESVVAVIERIIGEAASRTVPVQIGVGRTQIDVGHNRRWTQPDGSVVMLWRNAERRNTSPVDREAGVIRLDREDGSPLAVLFNYACHPVVLGPDNFEYSADYVGEACRLVEDNLKTTCLFLQGACGDINPYLDKSPIAQGGIQAMREIGRTVGQAITDAARTTKTSSSPNPSIVFDQHSLTAPLRWNTSNPKTAEVLSKAIGAYYQAYVEKLIKKGSVSLPLTTLLLNGQVALVGMPAEVFTDFQKDLKRRSPVRDTFLVGYTNGYYAYFPTIRDAAAGGYGGKTATYVAVGTGERMTDEGIITLYHMLDKLHDLPREQDFKLIESTNRKSPSVSK